ncbi:glycosyl transferase family 1 [Georgenia soli]|uniref:Glycosyl transferase family 1 n=1 Tax=Georgenia soli TaxID=638953 RepID=A0A2A9ENX5_9MICO|nr:glycosyltransferase [Georgenia soli]PFG39945.1 glycosyl transferase family 1 [Georgenia soli]
MKILIWHVHGSWLNPFVQGPDEYLIPVLPDRGPDGLGRARTWTWPQSARELAPEQLREEGCDVVVLQRPHEIELLEEWTGLRAGVDVPAVYVEHNTPAGPAAATRHPLADRTDIPVVHVTDFNALMWDCGDAPTTVIDHGIVDPGYRYTGEEERLGVVVNEPVRRWRVAGTDVLLRIADELPVAVHGMGMAALAERAPHLAGHLHEDVPQDAMHDLLACHRAYLHPYRWTSLGLSLLEAMTLGMPVLALASTAAPEAVPDEAGVVSSDPDVLAAAARRWLADPDEARERGLAARAHALDRFGLDRFLADWQQLLKEVAR